MKNKKLFVIILIIISIVVIFYYLNKTKEDSLPYEIKQGLYYDDIGEQIGVCEIEFRLLYLADMPTLTTNYYDLNNNYIGSCDGGSIGCAVSFVDEPVICNPQNLQKSCDDITSSEIYGSTAKYKCELQPILNKSRAIRD